MELAGGREYLRGHLWLAGLAILVLTAIAGVLTYLRGRWSTLASEAIARSLRPALRPAAAPALRLARQGGDRATRCSAAPRTWRPSGSSSPGRWWRSGGRSS